MSNQINVLSGILSGGTIAFHAIFAKVFRSIPVGVFLSQGYFWQENAKFRDREKYKTVEGKTFFAMTAKEWFEETSLTQEQQTRVRETLVKHKVLIEWLTDNPAKLYFHIDLEALVSVINQYLVSGLSVSVDNRNKNRFKTKTRLGKEPKQDLVNNPNTTIVESLDSFESEGEENTPTPETSTLKAGKKESPKVAEKGSFQSCSIPCGPSDFHENGKCAQNGCFEVPAIATGSEIPGVTLVRAAPFADENGKTWHDGTQLVQAAPIQHRKNGRIEIPDEAAAEILPWANGDGAQTIKGWYDRAYRQHSPKDVEAMVLKFSGVFLSSEKAAVRDMMETNPLAFFKKRFSGFIVDQTAFDRMNAPRNIGQSANANGQTLPTNKFQLRPMPQQPETI